MTDDQFATFRADPAADLFDWAAEFRDVLTHAAESIEADDTIVSRQNALARLVSDLVTLARRLPLPDNVDELDVIPLQHLLEALTDLKVGKAGPLFQPEERAGRSAQSHRLSQQRAYAVAFVSLLGTVGVPTGIAEEDVAQAFTKAGLRGHRADEVTANSVHSWRMAAGKFGSRPGEGHLAFEYVRLYREQSSAEITQKMIGRWIREAALRLAKGH